MPSTPSNDANGPKTHQRNLSKANGKEMYVTPTQFAPLHAMLT